MLRLVSFLLRSSKATFILAVIAGVISGISTAALVAVIHIALSAVQPTARSIIIGFVVLCGALALSRVISQFTLIKIGQKAVRDVRLNLSRQMLSTPLRKLEEIGSHRLMAVLTDDVMTISNGLVGIPMLCLQSAVVVGALVYLNWMSWKLFLILLASMLVGVVTVQIGVRTALSFLRAARKEEDKLFKHMRALLDGAKELKLHQERRNAFLGESLESTAARYQRLSVTGNSVLAGAISWAHVMFFVLMGLLLFVSPGLMNVNAVTLNGYVITMLYLLVPLDVIGSILPNLSRAGVSLENVESLNLLLREKAEDDLMSVAAPAQRLENIEMTGIAHSYYREQENSTFTLGPIDLSLQAGELVFLVGGNGSGKTTLAKLITGLYVPESGEIRLNGKAITDANREFYRQHFSAVFSDFFMFESLLGLKSDDLQSRANRYLTQFQLNHKVEIDNGVLSTVDLSQGQRKRLALLTAYLEDRPFYLFDEWAADQDPEFKNIFYHQLLPELKARGKTVLVITHDDRYYGVADRIVKLEDGKLKHDDRTAAVKLASDATSAVAGD
jgi:putative ATP-binding cassette transporter